MCAARRRPPMTSQDLQVLGNQLAAVVVVCVVALKTAGVPITDEAENTILTAAMTLWGLVTTIYTLRHRAVTTARPASRHRVTPAAGRPTLGGTINIPRPVSSLDSGADSDTGDIPRVDQPQ